jgi:hypothetical protein
LDETACDILPSFLLSAKSNGRNQCCASANLYGLRLPPSCIAASAR